jgi:hypothetical protein
MVGCLLAGCATQPTTSLPRESTLAEASAPGNLSALNEGLAPPSVFALRIGVEHLPPEESERDDPRDERLHLPTARTRARLAPVAAEPMRSAAERPLLDFANTDDPIAHETLRFVSDVIEADRDRVRREVGLPFFDYFHGFDADRGPLLRSEQDLLDAQELWVLEHGTSLLQRPFRRLLRRLPMVRDVEVEFDNFRSENVPLSEPYETASRRGESFRVSMRLRASDLGDPVEVAGIWRGLRLGSSQEAGKLSFDLPVTERLRLELRARTEYDTSDLGFRLDLSWRHSLSTSWHVAIGDDMDFLSTSSLYSLFETPMDGSPGLVLYAVHVF